MAAGQFSLRAYLYSVVQLDGAPLRPDGGRGIAPLSGAGLPTVTSLQGRSPGSRPPIGRRASQAFAFNTNSNTICIAFQKKILVLVASRSESPRPFFPSYMQVFESRFGGAVCRVKGPVVEFGRRFPIPPPQLFFKNVYFGKPFLENRFWKTVF